MSNSRRHEAVWLIVVATFFGGLIGALMGAWIADFNFYSRLSPAKEVVFVFAVVGVVAGLFSGTLLSLTPRRD